MDRAPLAEAPHRLRRPRGWRAVARPRAQQRARAGAARDLRAVRLLGTLPHARLAEAIVPLVPAHAGYRASHGLLPRPPDRLGEPATARGTQLRALVPQPPLHQ